MSLVRLILNILWILSGGLWMAAAWVMTATTYWQRSVLRFPLPRISVSKSCITGGRPASQARLRTPRTQRSQSAPVPPSAASAAADKSSPARSAPR